MVVLGLGSESAVCLVNGENDLWPHVLAQQGLFLCHGPKHTVLSWWLDIKMSAVNSLYSVKIPADKCILLPSNTWRKSHPFVKPTTCGWANCQVSYMLEMGKTGKRNGMCSGINCRGRVHTGFWVPSDWYLLMTARSKVWGQVLDPLSAFLMLARALLFAVFCGSWCFSYNGMK